MNAYPFIETEKVQQRNVTKACALLEVSRSAFHEWSKHTPSERDLSDAELAARIEAIHSGSRGTYGWPRVRAELRRERTRVGGKRVARIMRQRGLIGRCRRRWTKNRIPDPDLNETLVDRLKRVFGPGTVELDPPGVRRWTFAVRGAGRVTVDGG